MGGCRWGWVAVGGDGGWVLMCGMGGGLPALEHSKVCTLGDFGHLQFYEL
jgi:hypothetical protein